MAAGGDRMRTLLAMSMSLLAVASAQAGQLYCFSDVSGLAAEAEFTLVDPTTVEVRLKNTSTGVPDGFDSADQLLTGISWDFGLPGVNPGDLTIIGGMAKIGPTSQSLNFSSGSYGPLTDVGGEYGYGNTDVSGQMANFISGNQSGTTAFGGPNLDNPTNLDGPQAGLVANPVLVSLGGLGAIQNEIIATITLSGPLASLDDLAANGMRVEFGSDAHFINIVIPEPASLALVAAGGLGMLCRRRR